MISGGLDMSRSRKLTGKRTVKQVDAKVDELARKTDTLGTEFASFASAAANDIMKLNHLIYGLLDEAGKITKIICINCKKEAVRPDIEGIEQSENCPHCGRNLHKSEQITLDDLHRGNMTESGEDSEE
jgi:PHP family Zn ribbon phosphoesterase